MFAGPNGSGKTTLFRTLAREHSAHGVFNGEPFVNADEIDAGLRESGKLNLRRFGIAPTHEEMIAWLHGAAWNGETARLCEHLRMTDGVITVSGMQEMSYAAAQLAALIRVQLLAAGHSFTFETVMSHPGKVALFRDAKALGIRTYLYFVATDNVELNVCRVKARVGAGGHAVPEEKIRERYERSLGLLPQAVRAADRAFLFDNSTAGHVLLAEITSGKIAAIHVGEDEMPSWFRRLRSEISA